MLSQQASLWRMAVACALVPFVSAPAGAQLSRTDAVAAVQAEVPLVGDSLMWLPNADFGFGAGFEGLLPAGTLVEPAHFGVSPWIGNPVTLNNDMYVFFHDLTPEGRFVHEVQYIYVDSSDPTPTLAEGSISVQSQGWWMRVTTPGDPPVEFFEDRSSTSVAGVSNPEGLVLGVDALPDDRINSLNETFTGNLLRGGGPPPTPGSNPGAIVISGDDDDDMDNDVDAMEDAFEARGIMGDKLQSGKNQSYAQVDAMITNLCNEMPPIDHFYFYMSSHGGSGSLCFSDGSVPLTSDDENANTICKLIKKLADKGKPVEIIIDACHSGSLTDNLRKKVGQGVIITAAADGKCAISGAIRDCDGDPVLTRTRHGLLTAAMLLCWGDSDADLPANGGDGDGKVSWGEAFNWICKDDNASFKRYGDGGMLVSRSAKDSLPNAEGLPRLITEISFFGVKYGVDKEDLDKDGKYDLCTLFVDFDCDGNDDAFYLVQDKDEDGNANLSTCIRDLDDDGTPDERIDIDDPDDDGKPDSVKRFTLVNGEWQLEIDAPERQEQAFFSPPNGQQPGNTPYFFCTELPFFQLTQQYQVFVGPFGTDTLPVVDPVCLQGITGPGLLGQYPPLIVDWNPGSPTFGFVPAQPGNLFEYVPIYPQPEFVTPAEIPSQTLMPIILHGSNFLGPPWQVELNGQPIPQQDVTVINDNQIMIVVPPIFSDELVSVTLIEPNNGDLFTLVDPLSVLGPPDTTPPLLIPPGPIVGLELSLQAVVISPPATFQASATDSGQRGMPAIAQRLQEGALPVGLHTIDFLAWDDAGNTVTESSTIEVVPASCPGDLTTTGGGNPGVPDGTTDLADLLYYVNVWDADLGSPSPNPGSIADVTTTGGGDPGVPDGNVDLSDLLYFVNEWTIGLSACP